MANFLGLGSSLDSGWMLLVLNGKTIEQKTTDTSIFVIPDGDVKAEAKLQETTKPPPVELSYKAQDVKQEYEAIFTNSELADDDAIGVTASMSKQEQRSQPSQKKFQSQENITDTNSEAEVVVAANTSTSRPGQTSQQPSHQKVESQQNMTVTNSETELFAIVNTTMSKPGRTSQSSQQKSEPQNLTVSTSESQRTTTSAKTNWNRNESNTARPHQVSPSTQTKVRVSVSSNNVTTSTNQTNENLRTILVLMTSAFDNEEITNMVKELAQQLGDNFWVAWDNKDHTECPHKAYAQCIEDWPISNTTKLSHKCCAQEKAVMWAMDNRKTFDHVWFMEDDIRYSDMDYLLHIMNSQEVDADVVNQKHPSKVKNLKTWVFGEETRAELMSFFSAEQLDRHHHHRLMNFYRLSHNFLDKLEEVYNGMGQQWTFFEALFPTISSVYGLKWTKWTPEKHFMEFRPCHTSFTEPGIYHPVKYRDGKPFPCHCFAHYWNCAPWNSRFVPGAKECLDCPAFIRAAGNITLMSNFTLTSREQAYLVNLAKLAKENNTILEEMGLL